MFELKMSALSSRRPKLIDPRSPLMWTWVVSPLSMPREVRELRVVGDHWGAAGHGAGVDQRVARAGPGLELHDVVVEAAAALVRAALIRPSM